MASAGGGGPGQLSAVVGLRGSGPPPVLVAPALSLTGGGARPSAASYGEGGWGSRSGSGGGAPGRRPAELSPPHPLALIAWSGGVWLSTASSLAWGLELRRQRVPPAVAPLGEGVAQGPAEPVVGIRICDAEHRPPLQERWPCRLPVGPRRPNHRLEDPPVVFWGRATPQGHLLVPPIPPEEQGIEGPVPHPLGGPRAGPAQPPVHLHHHGEGLTPQGVWDHLPVLVPGMGPLCPPRRLPLRPLCLRPRGPAPPPCRRRSSHPHWLRPRGGLAGIGVGGVRGELGLRRRGRCCRGGRGGGGGGGCGAPAFVGCRGGCTAPAARPAARAPRAPSPPLCPALPSRLPCPVPSVARGALRPCPCPWLPSRPPRLCLPVHAVGPAHCHLHPGPHHQCPYSSCARAHALGRTHARRPRPAQLHALRGCLPWRPVRAPACPSRSISLSPLFVTRRAVVEWLNPRKVLLIASYIRLLIIASHLTR